LASLIRRCRRSQWSGCLVQPAQRARHGGLGGKAASRSGRGGGEVGDAEVGDVVVQRFAVGAEELAELLVGGEVAAVASAAMPRSVPGPGGHRDARLRVPGD
jgi:hypothetical protein